MDLMNDDAEVVRLEALDSLFHMAAHECFNVHEKHMHMVYCSKMISGLNLLVFFFIIKILMAFCLVLVFRFVD
jgi:hypothetical protein